jgi:hypothetical protein
MVVALPIGHCGGVDGVTRRLVIWCSGCRSKVLATEENFQSLGNYLINGGLTKDNCGAQHVRRDLAQQTA